MLGKSCTGGPISTALLWKALGKAHPREVQLWDSNLALLPLSLGTPKEHPLRSSAPRWTAQHFQLMCHIYHRDQETQGQHWRLCKNLFAPMKQRSSSYQNTIEHSKTKQHGRQLMPPPSKENPAIKPTNANSVPQYTSPWTQAKPYWYLPCKDGKGGHLY